MFGIKIKFRKKISDISIFLTKFFHNRVRNRRLVKVLFKIVCVKRTYSKYKQLNTSYALKKAKSTFVSLKPLHKQFT